MGITNSVLKLTYVYTSNSHKQHLLQFPLENELAFQSFQVKDSRLHPGIESIRRLTKQNLYSWHNFLLYSVRFPR